MSITGGSGQQNSVIISGLLHDVGTVFTVAGDFSANNSRFVEVGAVYGAGASVVSTATGDVEGVPITWTPAVAIGGSTTGITYTRDNGTAICGPTTCTVSFDIILSNKGAGTGNVTVGGLPQAAIASGLDAAGGSIMPYYQNMSSLTGALFSQTVASATYFNLGQPGSGGTSGITNTNLSNTSAFYGTFTYFVR